MWLFACVVPADGTYGVHAELASTSCASDPGTMAEGLLELDVDGGEVWVGEEACPLVGPSFTCALEGSDAVVGEAELGVAADVRVDWTLAGEWVAAARIEGEATLDVTCEGACDDAAAPEACASRWTWTGLRQ